MPKRLLLFLVALFLLINIGLFAFYFIKQRSLSTSTDLDTSQTPKQFIFNNRPYLSTEDYVTIFEGNKDIKTLSKAKVFGYIESEPIIDPKTQQGTVTMTFLTVDKKSVRAKVNLGKNDNIIITVFANNGLLNGPYSTSPESTSTIVPFLKKGDPLLLEIYAQQVPQNYYGVQINCKQNCQEFYNDINRLYSNNLNLIDSIKGDARPKENLEVGPVAGLTIYNRD